MNVLVLHSRYTSGPASGENGVVQDEIQLLRSAGHAVTAWTPMPDEGVKGKVSAAAAAVYSQKAVRMTEDLIRSHDIEVVHCHNLFPMLSPAVIGAARRLDRPVVMTLHNFRMMCLSGVLLLNGRLCEACVGKLPWRGVVHACYRGSRTASAAIAFSLTRGRDSSGFPGVTKYLAVSDFVARKHFEIGIPPHMVRVKPNFAWPGRRREGPGDYFLYLGRLSAEKGIDRLVDMWAPGWGQLRVVGEGPLGQKLSQLARPEVSIEPSVERDEALRLLRGARAVVIPSICFEGAPRVAAEAYAHGVPVIASDIGGLPEVVVTGETGFLVRRDRDWATAIAALSDDRLSEDMGSGAYRAWRQRFSPTKALDDLEIAYADAIAPRARRPATRAV